MNKRNVVGDNIRKMRLNAGITQEELALKSGLSQGYINQLESGKRRYTQKSLELIVDALSVSVAELFLEEEGRPLSLVAEETGRYSGKDSSTLKEFLTLLKELPEHTVEHYLLLLKMEKKLQKKKL